MKQVSAQGRTKIFFFSYVSEVFDGSGRKDSTRECGQAPNLEFATCFKKLWLFAEHYQIVIIVPVKRWDFHGFDIPNPVTAARKFQICPCNS